MKKIILSLSLLLIGIDAISQQEGFIQDGPFSIKTISDFYRLEASNVNNTKAFLKDNAIEGSPYLNDEFVSGYIITADSVKYVDVPLRYNIYNDEIEFQQQEDVFALVNPLNYLEIAIGNQVFISSYIANRTNGNPTKSYYFEVMNPQNKLLLLKRFGVQFIGPTIAKGYVNAKSAEFKKEAPRYYLKSNSASAQEIGDNKTTMFLFGDRRREVEAFMKREKLKLRKEDDLLKIVAYYNSF